ncbi:MAG: DNA gyrase/topoisomerase IV subunit A [Bacteroidales bacterium]|jgi:topoisomerase-4 subunit A|nr:DNA gyrase/topoisomerase IV subunit A [Bacteroidales bacterium]
MSKENKENTDQQNNEELEINSEISEKDKNNKELHKIVHLSGMYKDWFLDYASYVILERAVPHLYDGLKPVHRRILHAMKKLDDGRYNKVANIIGFTMQFHPHGDASIGDALVQLGQKDLLIDSQGNWGNILTGDGAAASRYIEARLSKFALDVVFNPKTTEWKKSYDGRNEEPVSLPVKFPLLLAQGVEGIAVGLASKILPHNFNELIDAAIAFLKGKSFELFPDFLTGGIADFSKYNDGIRGGSIKVRAKIEKEDKKTLKITELPYGRTTQSLIDSIVKVIEKGKIKIRKIDDNTAEFVEILIHLHSGTSPDQTIDALYAFTDCEMSISPNSCVIENSKPVFLGVSDMLKYSAENTVELLKKELQIRKKELQESWHLSSLEKIFIENRIYHDIEECETWESVIETIDKGLDPFKKLLMREVTVEDIEKLTEIKIKRITKFDVKRADEYIKGVEAEIKEVQNHLDNIIDFAINYFKQIRKKHGNGRDRKTEIRNLGSIAATQVVVANEKLYVNREEGFIGTGLKKDEYVSECSDIDEILVFLRDGKYVITKADDKVFVGKDIIHVAVFKRNDERTIYNIIYRDGLNGAIMIKRCAIKGITRDKDYNITKGTKGSKILYMTTNLNGEAEVVKVYLRPRPRLKKPIFEFDFSELAIKGRQSIGNILTKYPLHKIVLKDEGVSTLGGRKIWFEEEVLRLNADGRGNYLGEFHGDEKILIITKSGKYRLSNYDLVNHFEDDVLIVEKFRPEKIFSAVYYDADLEYYYVKRFIIDPIDKLTSFIGENEESRLMKITEVEFPRLEVSFGGTNKNRENEIIEIAEFIGVKSYKARGKRLSNYEVKVINELEPLIIKEEEPEVIKPSDEIKDNNTSQMSLFENGKK